MTEKNGTPPELYKRHRPQTWKEVIGQPQAVRTLVNFLKRGEFPHTLLLSGPSGCGKTTAARILVSKLSCADTDFEEVNAAESRGIDTIREVKMRMGLHPRAGKCRIWLFDEGHQLTGEAQDGLLKMLEDTPSHVYFFIATTNPTKLKETIRTRCTEVKFKKLSDPELEVVISSVLNLEHTNREVFPSVVEKIILLAEGSARKALVLLGQVLGLESEEDQLEAVQASEVERTADQIIKLLSSPRTKWEEVGKLLDSYKGDPEETRRRILGYAAAILRRNSKLAPRMYLIISSFEGNFFDSGMAGLCRACYEVFRDK